MSIALKDIRRHPVAVLYRPLNTPLPAELAICETSQDLDNLARQKLDEYRAVLNAGGRQLDTRFELVKGCCDAGLARRQDWGDVIGG